MLARDSFHGTKRFVVEGRLGAGGMGVVHRVRDLERGAMVALKTVAQVDPEVLLRFKKEFRSLADISHPNVVQLYELFSEQDQWFFTMELVDGVDLLTWVKSSLSMPPPAPLPHGAQHPGELLSTMALPSMAGVGALAMPAAPKLTDVAGAPDAIAGRPSPARGASRRFAVRDVGRLCDALQQLASGLMAIHSAGKLHRDVKPPNVMVTRSGRVVLLDFGLAADVVDRKRTGRDEPLAGTPAYMAPEQGAFQRATPASDWYAVGVVLYEALTGCLPFDGSPTALLIDKQRAAPLPPSAHVDGAPEHLERLAMDLLQREPLARPTGEQVLARLSGNGGARISVPAIEAPFVGRRALLADLHEAFEASASSQVVVTLHGRPGMGKTALTSRFLGELSSDPKTLVLSGRCYERETVPFKALDPVVDELAQWLSRLPRDEVTSLLPGDLRTLARVFPVLGDLVRRLACPPEHPTAPASVGGAELDRAEPQEVRRRAFAAMRALLASIAVGRRLVVHVDDLHWCDADSVDLLEALVAAPAPPWLLLCAYQSEPSRPPAAPLERLLQSLKALADRCPVRAIEVSELAPREAEELAATLIDSRKDGVAALVTAEARGNPLFLAELARRANERSIRPAAADGGAGLSLDQMIKDRVAALPAEARALLETLSVARGPLTHGVASRAASVEGQTRAAALARRSARLVVTRGLGDDDSIETAHDHVRRTVAESLAEDRNRACHAGIARALAETAACDAETVFAHFRAAGDLDSATKWVLRAAEASDRALAFTGAAALYRSAIDLRAAPLHTLHRRLGDALANAGRLAEAADAYVEGAAHAGPQEAIELRRMAAEDYLKSGRDTRGLEVLRSVLDQVDLSYPQSSERALASLVWHEAQIRVLPLRRRMSARVSTGARPADLARIDAAFAAATGLAINDPLRGADFASRGLLMALEAGEPLRLSRALAVAAGNVATRGEPARGRAEDLVRAAERIAKDVDEPRVLALALLAAGTVHFLLGEWRSARSDLERADAIFRQQCRAVAWELANTQAWTCNVLILSGDLREAAVRVPSFTEEAHAREDRLALAHMVYPASVSRIMADDVEGARSAACLAEGTDRTMFTSGRWGALISRCSIARYEGDGATAWRLAVSESKPLEASMLWRSAMVRVFSSFERGLSALSAASARRDQTDALRAVDRWAKDLSHEKLRYAPALGDVLRAGAAAVRGDRTLALAALDSAIPGLDGADLGYLAACARHSKGQLVGGSTGKELLERTRAFFSAQGIVNAERCLAMSAPGF
jgi:serine/threonine protein kinase